MVLIGKAIMILGEDWDIEINETFYANEVNSGEIESEV